MNSLTFVEGLSEFSEQLRQKALVSVLPRNFEGFEKCSGVLAATQPWEPYGAPRLSEGIRVLQNIGRF